MSDMSAMGDRSEHEFRGGDGRSPSGLSRIIREMVEISGKWRKKADCRGFTNSGRLKVRP